MQGEYYHWYKEHGICVSCAKKDAAPGRIMCDDCAERERERQKQRRKNNPLTADVRREYNKRHRKERLEQGLCPNCGKPLYKDLKSCYECHLKDIRYGLERRQKNPSTLRESRRKDGVCLKCGKPRVPGKFYCEECHQKSCKSLEKARKSSGWTSEYMSKKYFTKRYPD